MKNIFNVTFIIIGVILGAGFASGKEIYIFFSRYGQLGILGITISFILLGILIYKVIQITNENNINTYDEFLEILGTKNLIIKAVINTFLLISFYVMIAGFSAFFEQELNISKIITGITISVICYLIFTKELSGIIKINTAIIPILIIFIIIFGIKNINIQQKQEIINNSNNFKWLISAILYASYNSITIIPTLIPISKLIKNQKQNKIILILIPIITITLAIIINTLNLKIDTNINTLEIPMMYMANKSGKIYTYIYGIILILAIFTTAILTGYSFIKNNSKTKEKYIRINKIMCLSAIIVSNIGFSKLLEILYPLFGILGLIQILRIFAITIEKTKQN